MVWVCLRWIPSGRSHSRRHALASSVRVRHAGKGVQIRNIDVARVVGIEQTSLAARLASLLSRHYGVLLLYGQHLGINHLVGQNKIRIIIGHDRLDQSSTNKDPAYLRTGARLNFHCWHTNERFSKFAFKLGQYNRSELETYRNDTTAQAYVSRSHFAPRMSHERRLVDAHGIGVEIHDLGTTGQSSEEQFFDGMIVASVSVVTRF